MMLGERRCEERVLEHFRPEHANARANVERRIINGTAEVIAQKQVRNSTGFNRGSIGGIIASPAAISVPMRLRRPVISRARSDKGAHGGWVDGNARARCVSRVRTARKLFASTLTKVLPYYSR